MRPQSSRKADCHPTRLMVRDGRCRECLGVAASPEDPLPAIIANTVQHAGPVIPSRCSKCGSIWSSDGNWALCPCCGATFFRTSTRVLSPPRNISEHARAAQALRGRRDRVR